MKREKQMQVKSKVSGFIYLVIVFVIIALIWITIGYFFLNEKEVKNHKGDVMYQKITANLMVQNVNETAEFYKKYFGFRTTVTVPDSGDFDFAILNADKVELMFQKIESLGDDVPYLKNMPVGGSFTLFIEVSNVDEIYNRFKGEVEILVDMKTTFYGMKEVTVKDNNGYVLTFAEKVE